MTPNTSQLPSPDDFMYRLESGLSTIKSDITYEIWRLQREITRLEERNNINEALAEKAMRELKAENERLRMERKERP